MRVYHCIDTNVPSDIQGETLNKCVKDLKGAFEEGQAINRVILLQGYKKSLLFK